MTRQKRYPYKGYNWCLPRNI